MASKKNPFAGIRVELSPGCDLWMRGAKFGTIRKIVGQVAVIKMDHPQVKKLQRVAVDRLTLTTTRLIGVVPNCYAIAQQRVYLEEVAQGRLYVRSDHNDIPARLWADPDAFTHLAPLPEIAPKPRVLEMTDLHELSLLGRDCPTCGKRAVVPLTPGQLEQQPDGTTLVCHHLLGGCNGGFEGVEIEMKTVRIGSHEYAVLRAGGWFRLCNTHETVTMVKK